MEFVSLNLKMQTPEFSSKKQKSYDELSFSKVDIKISQYPYFPIWYKIQRFTLQEFILSEYSNKRIHFTYMRFFQIYKDVINSSYCSRTRGLRGQTVHMENKIIILLCKTLGMAVNLYEDIIVVQSLTTTSF